MRTVWVWGLLLLVFTGGANAACKFNMAVSDSLQFDTNEIAIEKNCEEITVNITHTGTLPANAMGHNWVLTSAEHMQPVALDGQTSGLENNYVPLDDDRVIANSEIIGGGESTSVSFSAEALEAGEDYRFICSAPGHWAVMQGKFIVISS